MAKRTVIAVAVAAAALGLSFPCAAVDPEQLYQAALADMKEAKYAEACPKFAEARRLQPTSTAALQGLALCYDKAGKSASAWTRYRELAVEFKTQGDKRAQAALDRAAELAKTLSTVRVKVASPDTAGLIIRLDREEMPRVMYGSGINVDPGEHIIEATAPGYEVWQTHFTIGGPNENREIQIPALAAKPAPTPGPAAQAAPAAPPAPFWGPQRIAGVAVGAAGVAGLAIGGALGGLALSKANSLKGGDCNADLTVCNSTGLPERQSAQGLAHGSTAALVVGGVALAAGVVVFATAPSGNAPPASGARVVLGPVAGAGMTGLLLHGGW